MYINFQEFAMSYSDVMFLNHQGFSVSQLILFLFDAAVIFNFDMRKIEKPEKKRSLVGSIWRKRGWTRVERLKVKESKDTARNWSECTGWKETEVVKKSETDRRIVPGICP